MAVPAGGLGATEPGVAFSILSFIKESFPEPPLLVMKNGPASESTKSDKAKIQVIFSTPSVVLLTPKIWLAAEKLAANPPPLGF